MKALKQGINKLENSKASFIYFVLSFIFIIALRNFIEPFSTHVPMTFSPFLHFSLFYIALGMSLMLFLHALLRIELIKIAKAVMFGFIILVFPPLIDLIISGGKGLQMAYLFPETHPGLAYRFITFWGNFSGMGITYGMRIEIAIVLMGIFLYCYIKTSKKLKSLLFTFLSYVFFFLFSMVPFIIKWILFFNSSHVSYPDSIFINFYLWIITLTGISFLYITNKKYLKLIWNDVKPAITRILHFILMPFLGFVLAMKYYPQFNFCNCNIASYGISVPIAIIFACLFAMVINNIEDLEIDKISNSNRILVSSQINLEQYKRLSWILLSIGLFYASLVNFQVFFAILLFCGIYFLYSAHPFRLKRIPILSKFLIALNSFILVLLGFNLATGSVNQFPQIVTAIFLIGFTLVINFIDIKDYEGDKKAGIKT